ncbi:MAG: PorV/PorQ family protein [bacterium]|nr:PorV/PorQ family protein [bacterium]
MSWKESISSTILITLFVFISLQTTSWAGEEKVGTTSASFLKIGVGAKATGMGEAFGGIADNSTAIYWNPAGLGFLKTNELSYMHNIWFQETTHGFLGYAHPLQGFTLGVGIDYLTMGEIEETTEVSPEGTGKKLAAKDDKALFLALSKRIKEDLSLGINLKYIRQKVADESANAYASDLGLLYKFSRLNLGLTLQNLGTNMEFADEESSLPFNIKAGLAYKGIKNTTLALDVNLPKDNKTSYHLGGEYWIGDLLAVRAGYNSHISGNELGKFNLGEGLSAGFGVNLKAVRLDAAYISYGDMGDAYRISLQTRFGEQKSEDSGQKSEDVVQPLIRGYEGTFIKNIKNSGQPLVSGIPAILGSTKLEKELCLIRRNNGRS